MLFTKLHGGNHTMKKTIRMFVCLVFILSVVCCVLTACKPKPVTISFEVDGENYDQITTAGNEELTLPASPLKQGSVFEGWYFDKDEWQNRFTASTYLESSPESDLTVYARWISGCTISFEVDGELYQQVTATGLTAMTMPSNPVKDGFKFDGWYFDNNVWENRLTASTYLTSQPSGDATVYAKWKKDSTDDLLFEDETKKEHIIGVKSNAIDIDSLVIPASVKRIDSRAFHETDWYKAQPDGLVYVEHWLYAYKGTLPEDVHELAIREGTVAISDSALVGLSTLTGVTIPDSVTTIGDSAFRASGLVNVTIPGSVTTIGDSAFRNCYELQSITVPSGVKTVGASAFSSCRKLESVTIGEGVTTISEDVFSYCTALSSVTIKEGVETIGSQAFSNCVALTSITLPNSLTSVHSSAFTGCRGITSATLPTTAINGLPKANLETVVISGGENLGNKAFYNCTTLSSVTLPEGLKTIGNEAFYGCSKLTSIKIPASVTTIGANAFKVTESSEVILKEVYYAGKIADWCKLSGLTNLLKTGRTIYIKNDRNRDTKVTEWLTISASQLAGVTSLSESVFAGFSSLRTVTLPDGLKSIGKKAFNNCEELTSVTIPEGVESIGADAFHACMKLTDINLPDSITSIGTGAFYACNSLKTITIPKGVTTISTTAFYSCGNLEKVIIPDTVTNIETMAFLLCRSLTTIEFKGTKAQWDSITKGSAWANSPATLTVVCSDETINPPVVVPDTDEE